MENIFDWLCNKWVAICKLNRAIFKYFDMPNIQEQIRVRRSVPDHVLFKDKAGASHNYAAKTQTCFSKKANVVKSHPESVSEAL